MDSIYPHAVIQECGFKHIRHPFCSPGMTRSTYALFTKMKPLVAPLFFFFFFFKEKCPQDLKRKRNTKTTIKSFAPADSYNLNTCPPVNILAWKPTDHLDCNYTGDIKESKSHHKILLKHDKNIKALWDIRIQNLVNLSSVLWLGSYRKKTVMFNFIGYIYIDAMVNVNFVIENSAPVFDYSCERTTIIVKAVWRMVKPV